MTEPRTVTLATADHGEITVDEPAWCAGHTHHDPESLRGDLIHAGPTAELRQLGHTLITAQIVQSPYATTSDPRLGGPVPGVSVYPPGLTLDPTDLYSFAAALDGYADRLRDLADQLAALNSEDDSQPTAAALTIPDPVAVLIGMARGLVERLAAREAPWQTVPAEGSVGSSTEQTIGGYVVELRAAISNPTSR